MAVTSFMHCLFLEAVWSVPINISEGRHYTPAPEVGQEEQTFRTKSSRDISTSRTGEHTESALALVFHVVHVSTGSKGILSDIISDIDGIGYPVR